MLPAPARLARASDNFRGVVLNVREGEPALGAAYGETRQPPDEIGVGKIPVRRVSRDAAKRALVTANPPASRIVGRTSPRQSGWRLVHAGSVREPPACNAGGCVQENCASQFWVFSVSKDPMARRSKHDELVNANSRVATFKRAPASSRPPPRLADKLVTTSSGARQNPLHSMDWAFSSSDAKPVSCAVHSTRYGWRLVHPAHAGSEFVSAPVCALSPAAVERRRRDPKGCDSRSIDRQMNPERTGIAGITVHRQT